MKPDRTYDNLNYKQRLIAKVEAGKATESELNFLLNNFDITPKNMTDVVKKTRKVRNNIKWGKTTMNQRKRRLDITKIIN